ncbi:hypothetical protein XELAEV_18007813mg [Xenopus laevis]|uniref:Large ribosomal subunit protein bL17m n=1 Tax=Xenopus laevis TaxID=8355 RepID=A0A974E3R6_XENLA|nr:hypothetical protein XELAEV_18007813mg [Xenopus laevis]
MQLFPGLLISNGRVALQLGLRPRSRLDLFRNLLTGLTRHERIETTWARAEKLQQYTEKRIDYCKQGDTDKRAMKMANFWLMQKNLIPKLFKNVSGSQPR